MRLAPICITACMLGLAVEFIREVCQETSRSTLGVVTKSQQPLLPRPHPRSDRASERRRRPQPPLGKEYEMSTSTSQLLDDVESKHSVVQLQCISAMPATDCRSTECVPWSGRYKHAYVIHGQVVQDFNSESGFGVMRGPYHETHEIERVELVSLLLHEDACAYVLHERPTLPQARLARRRPLDEFEQLGLQAIREGADLVWTPEEPTRMLGAIRADHRCLDCHSETREHDLLGALTYYMKLPINELTNPDQSDSNE